MHSKAFHSAFRKDIKDLPKEFVETVREATNEIIINPYSYERLTGVFSDYFKFKLKGNRVDYRIIFTIDEQTVIFVMVKKRENLYSYLKRRLLR